MLIKLLRNRHISKYCRRRQKCSRVSVSFLVYSTGFGEPRSRTERFTDFLCLYGTKTINGTIIYKSCLWKRNTNSITTRRWLQWCPLWWKRACRCRFGRLALSYPSLIVTHGMARHQIQMPITSVMLDGTAVPLRVLMSSAQVHGIKQFIKTSNIENTHYEESIYHFLFLCSPVGPLCRQLPKRQGCRHPQCGYPESQ